VYCLLSETYGYRGSCCLPPVCCNTDVLIQARASITSRVSDLNVIIEPRWFYSRIYHNRLLPVYCSPIFPFQVCLIFYFSDRESYDPQDPLWPRPWLWTGHTTLVKVSFIDSPARMTSPKWRHALATRAVQYSATNHHNWPLTAGPLSAGMNPSSWSGHSNVRPVVKQLAIAAAECYFRNEF